MLRTATADDWRAITGMDVPGHWIGLVCEEDGHLVGLGGLYEGTDGRWWATVKANARRPVALYRAAREVLETAAAVGVPVHALADDRIDGAERFLRRIGFKGTGEMIEGYEVLRWTL